jgi:hypothetical protein
MNTRIQREKQRVGLLISFTPGLTRSSILILNHPGLTRPGHSPTPLQEWLLRCDSVVLASYVGLGLRAQFVLRA